MNTVIFLFLAAIFAGYALINFLTPVNFLADIHPFFVIVGGLAIVVFSLILIFMALKALFNNSWR